MFGFVQVLKDDNVAEIHRFRETTMQCGSTYEYYKNNYLRRRAIKRPTNSAEMIIIVSL